MRCSNNNKASAVFDLFIEATKAMFTQQRRSETLDETEKCCPETNRLHSITSTFSNHMITCVSIKDATQDKFKGR